MVTVRTEVALPDDVYASLEALALRTGRTRSALIAELITERVRSEPIGPEQADEVPAGIEVSRRRIALASRQLDEMGYEWENGMVRQGEM